MDALYILGFGSPWENNELRFSMRSLERHVRGIDRVVVVGENPGFLSREVEYHYFSDPSSTKEYNIAAKIIFACQNTSISDEFMFINDDHVFVKPTDAVGYPNYWKCLLEEAAERAKASTYGNSLRRTGEYLRSLRAPTRDYDVHTPILYEKGRFLGLMPTWEESRKTRHGFVVKSSYVNLSGGLPGPQISDLKFFNPKTEEEVRRRVADRHVFSYSDTSLAQGVSSYLYREFPDKSRFES